MPVIATDEGPISIANAKAEISGVWGYLEGEQS